MKRDNRPIVGLSILIIAAQAVPAWAGDVTVVTTLPAQLGTNFKSNIDLSGAVGLKHVVSFNGGGFVVYDKATGKVIERLSQSEFWTKRVAASYAMDPEGKYNDPKLIYDPLSDRWFATVAPHNISYLAVSTSGDPTKLWRGVILPLPTVDPGLTTGVDKHGLYVCAANGNPDSQQGLDCLAIPIADATSADGPVLANAQSFTKLHFMAYPPMDINPNKAPDAPAILMNNEFSGFVGSGKLYLYKITWSGNKASISEVQTIPLSKTYDTSRPECEQPGPAPKLRASSAVRTESIVVHGGSVFGCHAAKLTPQSRLGIVWYEVRIKDGALLQEGFIDGPNCDYLYPSLALDRAGNLGIGCSRVSQTEYPSIYVMMRAATDPPNTMRPPVLVVPGTTAYKWGIGNPAWCHYSSTCIDPSDPDQLWTCQPFSTSTVDKEWCTTWAAFKLSSAASPTSRRAAGGTVTPPPLAPINSAVAAETETFSGTAARTGTYKRPLLQVNGKRYELKASDKADASVAETLAKFSAGDTNAYAIVGTRGTVNGNEGIIVDRITPAAYPLPSAGATTPGTKAVQGNAPPAPAQTTPTVTSSVVTVGSDRYLVCNYDDLATRNHTVVIPEGLKTVRGLLVHACYTGGDSRNEWKICEYYRQFMHLHGFAYVGCTATAGSPRSVPKADDTPAARHRGIFQAFEDSMQVVATASRHPELVNAPYVGVGFSAGGGFAFYLMVYAPDKTIAAVSYAAPYIFKRRLTSPPSPAVLNVPSICITGESEHFNAPFAPGVDPSTASARIDEVFLPYRPKGAEYAWLERQGLGHAYDENRQDVLGMPLLDAAVRARYPKDGDMTKGPIKLLPIDPSTGWIADNATWKSGLTKIYPAKDFKGDLGHSSWLLNEDIAFIYRAYSTYDKPLTITSPGNCWPTVPPLDPGASAPIVVDASKFPNWKTMAFYDGAKKLAEITQGPPQVTATKLTPGYHVFSVLATDGQGTVRTADPKMVVVRPLP